MEPLREPKRRLSTVIVVFVAIAMLAVGSLLGYWVGYTSNSTRISSLTEQLSLVQKEISSLQAETGPTIQNQEETLAAIDALESQLSTIASQIGSLQTDSESSQIMSQINAEVTNLQSQLTNLKQQINEMRSTSGVVYENVTVIYGDTILPQLFEQVRESVVVIQGLTRQTDIFGRVVTSTVQGSGFASSYNGQMIVVTCNHVVKNAISINVTFSNGNKYTASLKGANANTDVAILTTNAPAGEYKPLFIANSSTLRVGDPVIVIGTPYGLEGSMSTGIVSATNRTIVVDQTTMTNMIQTTAPLNPGNSGGPLMNYQGIVIGMADAIIQESQGIGLAVPSNTIQQDISRIMG